MERKEQHHNVSNTGNLIFVSNEYSKHQSPTVYSTLKNNVNHINQNPCNHSLACNNIDNVQNSESDEEDLSFSLRSVLEENDVTALPPNFKLNESWNENNKICSNNNVKKKLVEVERRLNFTLDLLAETEETNVKLSEQVNLLKEEIRRIERNNERSAHITHNAEYLKNIILTFLAPQKAHDTRQQMLPILRMMLKLSAKECCEIEKAIVTTPPENASRNENEKATTSSPTDWTSYISSLSGIF